MGKKKVPVVLIKNVNNRRNTFCKRLIGLMKKAHDLSILCNAKIAVVVIDEQEVIYPYTNNNSVEEIWEQYSANSPQEKRERLEFSKEKLRTETEKAEKARLAKNDANQEDYSSNSTTELQEHHNTLQNTEVPLNPHWNNNCMPQQYTNCGSSSSSIPQVIKYHNTNSIQYTPSNNYDFSRMAQNGPNMHFIGQIPMMDANGNELKNWSNTNGTNCENNQQPKQEHQIPFYESHMLDANGNNWLTNTNGNNRESNEQPNHEHQISIHENNVESNLHDIDEAFQNHPCANWAPELSPLPNLMWPEYPELWGPTSPITPARWEGLVGPATGLEPPSLYERSVSEAKDKMP